MKIKILKKQVFIVLILFLITYCFETYANKIGSVTGYPIPRFVSLKSNDVNLRVGPSLNYPIEIKYTYQNFPVEIIDEYDVWRKSRDVYGNIGWIHKSLLKGDRYGVILSGNSLNGNIFNYPDGNKRGSIGTNNLVEINRCIESWCLIKFDNNKGWINKKNIWGVYKSEIYKNNYFQPLINLYWKILSYNWLGR